MNNKKYYKVVFISQYDKEKEPEFIGIGKVIKVYDNGNINLKILDKHCYRNIQEPELTEVTEKEYINYLKQSVKELSFLSASKRKKAAEYNKSVNGLATQRKGKVDIVNGRYSYTLFAENPISAKHTELINDSKKLKALITELKAEIKQYNDLQKWYKETGRI